MYLVLLNSIPKHAWQLNINYASLKNSKLGAGEMALRVLIVQHKGWNLIPSTYKKARLSCTPL